MGDSLALVVIECSHLRDHFLTGVGTDGLTLKRILAAQLGALIVVVIVLSVLAPDNVRSSLFGMGISIAANGYAAWRVFSRTAEEAGQNELLMLYRAEFGKLVIVGALCAVVFSTVEEIRITGFLVGLLTGMIAATVAVVTQKVQLPVNKET